MKYLMYYIDVLVYAWYEPAKTIPGQIRRGP